MHGIFTYMGLICTGYVGKYTVDTLGMNRWTMIHHEAYLQGFTIMKIMKLIFLFPRWDLLDPWRVSICINQLIETTTPTLAIGVKSFVQISPIVTSDEKYHFYWQRAQNGFVTKQLLIDLRRAIQLSEV